MLLSHLKGALLIFAFFLRERLDLTCLTCKNKEAKYLCFYGIFVAYYLLVCCSDFDTLYMSHKCQQIPFRTLEQGESGMKHQVFLPTEPQLLILCLYKLLLKVCIYKKKKVKTTRRLIWLV